MIKKHKGKILLGFALLLLLVVSFFAGEPLEKTENVSQIVQSETVLEEKPVSAEANVSAEPVQTENEEKQAAEEKEVSKGPENEPKTESIAPLEEPEEVLPAQKNDVPTCSLVVRCDSVFEHLDDLKDGKEEILPKDGIILNAENISFSEGESAFDVLKRELRARGIHLEFVETPMYNSVYIEGIANLYEFDCGNLSGWMYQVNGIRPTYGCSQYILKNQDRIEFFFSADWRE